MKLENMIAVVLRSVPCTHEAPSQLQTFVASPRITTSQCSDTRGQENGLLIPTTPSKTCLFVSSSSSVLIRIDHTNNGFIDIHYAFLNDTLGNDDL